MGEGYPSPQAAYPSASGGAPMRSFWPCSGRGLPCHSLLPGSAVGSYPTFSPLPAPEDIRPLAAGGLFSVALSRDCSLRALPGVLPCGARTFLPEPFQRARSNHLLNPPLFVKLNIIHLPHYFNLLKHFLILLIKLYHNYLFYL